MGKLTTLVACLFIVACGDPEDPFTPPGSGPDAPPRPDASPDGPPVDGPADAFVSPDGPLPEGPPVITLQTPDEGQLVSGVLRLEARVQDLDGVSSVTATIAGTHTITMARVSPGSEVWGGNFDTAPLAGLIAPTIIIRATDTTMASSQLGFEVVLDNEGPISSIDPPAIRERRTEEGARVCGEDFDPVGSDTPNDGESVPQLIELRARVVDVGNNGTLNTDLFVPHAGVQAAQVYVLDDTTKPLIVDTDGDGFCDAINPTLVPKTVPMLANEAARVDLASIGPTGSSHYGPDTGIPAGACVAGTATAEDRPPALCLGEPSLTRVIAEDFTNEAVIWGIPPVTGFNCAGFALDARATNIADGWACAAILATDKLGNARVSAPLRMCVDADGNGAECGAWGSIAAEGVRPNCTGTFAGGVVTNTACTPVTFPSGEILDPS